MSEDITPVDRPCANPANARLANELAGVRHAINRYASMLGDIERTVRLVRDEATQEVRQRIGVNIEGLGHDLVDEGQRMKGTG
jgi:hypothetical protein